MYIIDTKPIPLLERARANRSILVKTFRQWRINPAYGYCAAKKEKYFGFKLVVLWNKDRIVCYSLVSANESEQKCLMELIEKYQYSYWDSLLLASSLENKCSIIYSEDMQHEQIIEKKLKIINPFEI